MSKARVDRFSGFQDLNSAPSDGGFSGKAERQPGITPMGFQFLTPMMEQSKKAWAFEPFKSRGAVAKTVACDDELFDGGDRGTVHNRAVSLGLDEDCNGGRGGGTGHTKLCARGHWRPAEDAKLKELVAQFGPQNWNLIAEHLKGRSGKSCRLRWFNQLDPRINRRAFTEEEEERLLVAHRMYGNKWAMIAGLFSGRTDNAVKNHWHVIMARKQREQTNLYRKRKFLPPQLALVARNGTSTDSTTVSSNRNESASTCTELSLSPSSSRPLPVLFGRSPRLLRLDSQICSPSKRPALEANTPPSDVRSSDYSRSGTHCTGPKKPTREDSGSGNSDLVSNSDISGAESITNNNLLVSSSPENSRSEDRDLHFIDFLGVGTT